MLIGIDFHIHSISSVQSDQTVRVILSLPFGNLTADWQPIESVDVCKANRKRTRGVFTIFEEAETLSLESVNGAPYRLLVQGNFLDLQISNDTMPQSLLSRPQLVQFTPIIPSETDEQYQSQLKEALPHSPMAVDLARKYQLRGYHSASADLFNACDVSSASFIGVAPIANEGPDVNEVACGSSPHQPISTISYTIAVYDLSTPYVSRNNQIALNNIAGHVEVLTSQQKLSQAEPSRSAFLDRSLDLNLNDFVDNDEVHDMLLRELAKLGIRPQPNDSLDMEMVLKSAAAELRQSIDADSNASISEFIRFTRAKLGLPADRLTIDIQPNHHSPPLVKTAWSTSPMKTPSKQPPPEVDIVRSPLNLNFPRKSPSKNGGKSSPHSSIRLSSSPLRTNEERFYPAMSRAHVLLSKEEAAELGLDEQPCMVDNQPSQPTTSITPAAVMATPAYPSRHLPVEIGSKTVSYSNRSVNKLPVPTVEPVPLYFKKR